MKRTTLARIFPSRAGNRTPRTRPAFPRARREVETNGVSCFPWKAAAATLWFLGVLTVAVWNAPVNADDDRLHLKSIDEGSADLLLIDEKYEIRLYLIGENDKEHMKYRSLFFSHITQSLSLMKKFPEHFQRLRVIRIIFSDHRGQTSNIPRGVIRIGAHNFQPRHRDAFYWAGTIAHEITHQEQHSRIVKMAEVPDDVLEYHANLYELDFLKRAAAPDDMLRSHLEYMARSKVSRLFFDDKEDIGDLIAQFENYLGRTYGFRK